MTKSFSVYCSDYYGNIFTSCDTEFISDAVALFNAVSGWHKELVDNTTGEVLANYSAERGVETVLEVK